MKQRGFEVKRKTNKLKYVKGMFLFLLFLPIFSIFSFLNKAVYAEKSDLLGLLSNNLRLCYKKSFPSYLWKLIFDYRNWKNILKNEAEILYFLNYSDILSQIFWLNKANVDFLVNAIKSNFYDILDLLWKNTQKTYLIIFENTWEERPDSWFFWSFAKITLSWWHVIDWKIFDSYYVLWKYCDKNTKNLPKKDWFKNCNKKWLATKNNLKPFDKIFPTTTFITSNIFGFTDLNAKNIVHHYNKVFDEKIDWVIFVKSDILKYLFPDWEKLIWEMEYLNWKAKNNPETISNSRKIPENNENLKWLEWKKAQYLLFVNDLLKDKKMLAKNFINNFDKIKQEGLIRAYFFNKPKFNKFLASNNFQLVWDKNKTYFFFYNFWFNKNSKFVDHLIEINWKKILANKLSYKFLPGLHRLNVKSIYMWNFFYDEFLKLQNVPKTSYLWWKKMDYKFLLILQKNCKLLNKSLNSYTIFCE